MSDDDEEYVPDWPPMPDWMKPMFPDYPPK